MTCHEMPFDRLRPFTKWHAARFGLRMLHGVCHDPCGGIRGRKLGKTGTFSLRGIDALRQNPIHQLPGDIGQPVVAAGVAVGEAFVVEA